jgi:ribosomal protection tetracycline resistance protein
LDTLNLGILAHVDAGKTSLTERLLYAAGVIDHVGRVDDGDTQTDTLVLERRRGITIKSAVVSFEVSGTVVNLIDTPGHPDFIAEVERVLDVLDGVVLVVSAVEGVQPQTRVLMRTLRRLGLPVLVFVNKIDRRGARSEALLGEIAAKLGIEVVPMGSVRDLGTKHAAFVPYAGTAAEVVEPLADHDDLLLTAYLADRPMTAERVRSELAELTRTGQVYPVFFGSAITGAGVAELTAGIVALLPAAGGDADADPSGSVFKIERGQGGEKVALIRMFNGSVRIRDRLRFGAAEDAVTRISVVESGAGMPAEEVTGGRIARVWGLAHARIGDPVGRRRGTPTAAFAPPTLETVVIPARPAEAARLHQALTELAEQDPLINVRTAGAEISVSLFGEVQKEVIEATLADEYGLRVAFRETTTICIERVVGTGEAVTAKDAEDNPFLAGVGLRIEPAPLGSGVAYARDGFVLGTMPPAFFTAVEEAVHATLAQGLHGCQVTDCRVTLTHTGYFPRQSHAHAQFDKSMSSTGADFRQLTPLVVMAALSEAGTRVCEPVHRFRLELPSETLAATLAMLAEVRAVPYETAPQGASFVLEGDVPADQVHTLTRLLPGVTHGEGLLETNLDRYRPVAGIPPTRPRTDANPLDRKEYLLRVTRRAGG